MFAKTRSRCIPVGSVAASLLLTVLVNISVCCIKLSSRALVSRKLEQVFSCRQELRPSLAHGRLFGIDAERPELSVEVSSLDTCSVRHFTYAATCLLQLMFEVSSLELFTGFLQW